MAASKNSCSSSDDNHCLPCLESGDTKKGTMFCVDCGIYYCDRCLSDHNKFPVLRKHKIVHESDVPDIKESGSTEVDESTEKCLIHPGQVLTKFCHDHDEVCCPGCLTIKHRYCETVESLKDAAKNISSSKECNEYKNALKNTFNRIQEEEKKRKENLSSLDEEQTEAVGKIEKRGEELFALIKEGIKASKCEIGRKHSECVTASEAEFNELETLKSVYVGMSKNIEATNLSEIEFFVRLKRDKDTLKNLEKTVNEISDKWQPQKIAYVLENVTDIDCLNLKTFGYFSGGGNMLCSVKNRRDVNVKVQSDGQQCGITSICELEDGTYIISDYINKNVKRISQDYKVVDSIGVNGEAIAVCATGKEEFAVGLRNERKVQFVSCEQQLLLSSSFCTHLRCTGLYFDSQSDELYVSCGAEWLGDQRATVNVYSKDGTLKQSFGHNEYGSRLFRSPNDLTFLSNIGTLLIADRQNGLVALSKTGKLHWFYNSEKLKEPWGLCLLPDDQVLVTDLNSQSVLGVKVTGNAISEVNQMIDNLRNPYTLLYDRKRLALMVGCESNTISIFQIHTDVNSSPLVK